MQANVGMCRSAATWRRLTPRLRPTAPAQQRCAARAGSSPPRPLTHVVDCASAGSAGNVGQDQLAEAVPLESRAGGRPGQRGGLGRRRRRGHAAERVPVLGRFEQCAGHDQELGLGGGQRVRRRLVSGVARGVGGSGAPGPGAGRGVVPRGQRHRAVDLGRRPAGGSAVERKDGASIRRRSSRCTKRTASCFCSLEHTVGEGGASEIRVGARSRRGRRRLRRFRCKKPSRRRRKATRATRSASGRKLGGPGPRWRRTGAARGY